VRVGFVLSPSTWVVSIRARFEQHQRRNYDHQHLKRRWPALYHATLHQVFLAVSPTIYLVCPQYLDSANFYDNTTFIYLLSPVYCSKKMQEYCDGIAKMSCVGITLLDSGPTFTRKIPGLIEFFGAPLCPFGEFSLHFSLHFSLRSSLRCSLRCVAHCIALPTTQ
jgi:hypothetical protein